MQISRLFGITYLLLDKKMMTAKALAAHFGVSARTIYRDVETLSQAGIPIYACKGTGGGIRLTENFVLNKSVLTREEQQGILASLHSMKALKLAEAQPALEKLSTLFGGEREDWIAIDFSAWNTGNPVSKRFEMLKEAILARRVTSFMYSAADGKTGMRTVEPVQLAFRERDWYLLGWCRLRAGFRFFKLTRMGEPQVTNEGFERRCVPEDFLTQHQYAVELIEVTARFNARAAYRVMDEFEKGLSERQSDGTFLVRFKMPGTDWLYQYLMTYGADVYVLSPQSVREELSLRLKKALTQYEI